MTVQDLRDLSENYEREFLTRIAKMVAHQEAKGAAKLETLAVEVDKKLKEASTTQQKRVTEEKLLASEKLRA